jgi:P-type E1-E2 ATPase
LIAIFCLRDTLKADAKKFIDTLKILGKSTFLVSGDDTASVQYAASELGIKNYFSNCTPEEKIALCQKFSKI